MASTYGFGGSEPATSTDPGVTAQDVNTGTSQYVPGTDSTIRDTMQTDGIAGQSPVTGMGLTPTWDDSISGKNIDYTTDMIPVSSDGKTSTIGRWPIQYDYSVDGNPVTHKLADPTPMVGEG